MERVRGSQEKQLHAQPSHGANIPAELCELMGSLVVHSSSMKRCLWQEGISFSNDFSLLCFLW